MRPKLSAEEIDMAYPPLFALPDPEDVHDEDGNAYPAQGPITYTVQVTVKPDTVSTLRSNTICVNHAIAGLNRAEGVSAVPLASGRTTVSEMVRADPHRFVNALPETVDYFASEWGVIADDAKPVELVQTAPGNPQEAELAHLFRASRRPHPTRMEKFQPSKLEAYSNVARAAKMAGIDGDRSRWGRIVAGGCANTSHDGALRAAAWALACRHLIGDVFRQADYDALVAPWVAVMGPVHPDDEQVAA